jgi:hypothetical protein
MIPLSSAMYQLPWLMTERAKSGYRFGYELAVIDEFWRVSSLRDGCLQEVRFLHPTAFQRLKEEPGRIRYLNFGH